VDPTGIDQPAAGTTEPHAAEPPVQTMANDQAVVGDIPAQRPGFQPRPALLAQLNRVGQGRPVVVLTGNWGVGKTHLAAAHARARLADGWRLIAWVNARDSESLLAGLAAVAEATVLSDGGSRPGPTDAGRALRHWLEADGSRCLLVFDDAEDLGLLRPFLPAAGAARVLIIVARQPVAELEASVPVDVFSAEEALALLDERTGLGDEAGASAVAAELGHLPLALDQAAAVIAGQHLGYAAYLEKLLALPVEDELVSREDAGEQSYPPGVAEAVLLSLQAARAADPVGVCAAVMEVMAVLSPASVRCDLLRAAGQVGGLIGGGRRVAPSMVDQALRRLNERSLLDLSLGGRAVSMHCLVARVVRDGLARRNRLATACRAAASALEMSAEALAKPRDHAAVREMLGQVTALLENAGARADDADEALTGLLIRLRLLALDHLVELGDSMPHAIAIGEPLTADLERLLGPIHPDTLNAGNRLAAAYQAAGHVTAATPLFERILSGRERLFGPDHPDTLSARSSLAAVYHAAGRNADAIPLVRQTLAARERLFGADHPSTLASRNNLAAAYRAAGQAAEAIPLFEQNAAACERLLGADDSSTLNSRSSLAAAYRDVGRRADAIALFEQTLAARERILGPDHPDTMHSREILAATLRDVGRPAGAIPPTKKAPAAPTGRLSAHSSGRVLPLGFRWPPADPAGHLLPATVARGPAGVTAEPGPGTEPEPADEHEPTPS
jgi:tetratricopeptide (TPR) repeat protein